MPETTTKNDVLETAGPPGRGVRSFQGTPLTTSQRELLQEKALELNLAGHSFSRIAEVLSTPKLQASWGFTPLRPIGRSMVERLIDRELRPRKEKAAIAKERLIRRHESIVAKLWANRGTPRTADSINRQLERIAKLKGLDAPVKVKAEVDATVNQRQPLPLQHLTDEELNDLERIVKQVAVRGIAVGPLTAPDAGGEEPEDPDDEPDDEPDAPEPKAGGEEE